MAIKNENKALYWATGIDNSGLREDANEAKSIIDKMSDDVSSSAKQTAVDIETIGKTAIESAKAQISEQKSIIKGIESDIKNLESIASKAAPGNAKSTLLQEVNSAKRALEEEKAILAGLEQQVDKVGASHVRLRTQIMNVKDELSQMEMAGKRGTVEYDLLQKKLGELNDQFKDTAAQATILADDQRGFQAITQGVSGMAGAMSAATGVASLLGSENEDLAKVQMRLQAVMAITIGLQQVSEMLNKDSYFSVVLLSKAKETLAASELKLATATGVSTAAARAFMIATGAVVIVGLIALVAAISSVSEAHKKQAKEAQDAAKAEQEASAEIAKGYAAEKSKVESLVTAIHSENVSRDNKLKMIKQLKEMIPGYTAELSKEGTVIRENKKAIDEYMISLEKSLKLKAAEKELEAIYTKMYKLEKLSDTGEQGGNQFTKGLAKQGDVNPNEAIVQNSKKALAKGAVAGISELQKEADTIKDYISKTGLVSDEVLKETTDKAQKAAREKYNATKDINALLLDINQQTAKLLLDQQEDTLNKRLALIENEKQQELQAIRDKETKIIEEYNKSQKQEVEDYNSTHKNKKTFTPLSTKPEDLQASLQTIDPALAKQLQTATVGVTAAYGQKAVTETNNWNKELLALAREFADERVQIAFDYNEKIKKLEDAKMFTEADAAKAQRDKKISETTESLITETELYKSATNEKLNASKETTEKLIADIKARIEAERAAGVLSDETAKKMLADVNQAQETVKGNKNKNNPFAQLGDAITGNTEAGKALKAGKADPKTTISELADLESKAKEAQMSMAGAAGAALQGVSSILGSVVDGLDKLGLLTEGQKKDAENVIGMVGGAADLAMGIATGNPMAIIQGSIDLIVNAYELFDTRTKDANKEIEKQQAKIDSLKETYENLSDAVDKALSTKKYKLINDQIANIEQQNKALQAQIDAENSKKKADKDVLSGYSDTIKENNKNLADLKDSSIEALTGTDVMSALDSFAQAYEDAWTSGENAAKKSTDVVKGLLKTALIDYMKSQLQPQVEGVMKAIANAMIDGSISQSEQAAIDVLTGSLDAKAQQYKNALDPYLDRSKQSGVTGELKAAMTEGTGSQLVGLWNMTAMDIRAIKEWLVYGNNVDVTNKVDASDNVGLILSETRLIQTNTLRTAEGVEYIASVVEKLIPGTNNSSRSIEL